MPRANRHYLPNRVWHLTHRCHKREFLLKFARDRRRWTAWLFEAKKRYGLKVLNFVVTSNHVHLLVFADSDRLVIPRAMQLLAGRTAQEFNQRKRRNGAFWEDRYHATAVESGEHLRRCMTYIDMNMVRAGAVKRPEEWECCGYGEIQDPPQRYARIDRDLLSQLLEMPNPRAVAEWQVQAHSEAMCADEHHARCRRSEWTLALAVGSLPYIQAVQRELGVDGRHRHSEEAGDNGTFVLREEAGAYTVDNGIEMDILRSDTTHAWQLAR